MNEERSKFPAIPMYTADYLNDQKLRLCSMAAQGFWVRMLFVMHSCEPYGHLTFHKGEPATYREIAQVTGVHTNRVTPWVTELERHGVFSRTLGGVIYSRRMVRDESKRLINQQNGRYGGNPNLRNSVNPPFKPEVKPPVKALAVAVAVSDKSKSKALVGTSVPTPVKIPYEELRTAYNERRGVLPEARAPLSDEAKEKIRTRWKKHGDMNFWLTIFEKAGKSEFMVRFANFHWLMKNEMNLTKTIEGNYDNGRENRSIPRQPSPLMPREILPNEKDLPTSAEVSDMIDRAGIRRRKRKSEGLTKAADITFPIPLISGEVELPV